MPIVNCFVHNIITMFYRITFYEFRHICCINLIFQVVTGIRADSYEDEGNNLIRSASDSVEYSDQRIFMHD